MQRAGCLATSAYPFQPLWHIEFHGLLFSTSIVQDHFEVPSHPVTVSAWVAAAGIASKLLAEEPAAFLSCRYAAALMDSSF